MAADRPAAPPDIKKRAPNHWWTVVTARVLGGGVRQAPRPGRVGAGFRAVAVEPPDRAPHRRSGRPFDRVASDRVALRARGIGVPLRLVQRSARRAAARRPTRPDTVAWPAADPTSARVR